MFTVSLSEYQKRRTALLSQLKADDIAIIPANSEIIRTGDTPYPFRQYSNFYYLTGFNEPDAYLVLIPGHEAGAVQLFNRPRDPAMEIWNGHRAGQVGAIEQFGMDIAYPIDQFSSLLPDLLKNRQRIVYPMGQFPWFDTLLQTTLNDLRARIRSGMRLPAEIIDICPLLHEARLRKSTEEIALMQKASEASVAGHLEAMSVCQPGKYEYELEAALRHAFFRQGCREVAYSPIVGGGANACILHYIDNEAELKFGDLVLVDAGGEYGYYAADITRTYPVSGRFTPEQRAIYDLVLAAQTAAIDAIKPGLPYDRLQAIIRQVLTRGLMDLGILIGDYDTLIDTLAVNRFYMHNAGHWLGLDTHDVGAYKVGESWRPLEPGFVLTIEPGLYFTAQTPNLDPKWWNIGVRIEDNIVVTETGHLNLTSGLIKTADDIEAWMNT